MANLTQELIAEQANAPIAVAIAAAAAAGIDATAHPDPANPRAALVRYTTRLNRGSFEVPFPYLDPLHLFAVAMVDEEWLEMTPRFIGPQTVHLPITVDVEQVVIYRHTPRVVPTPPDGTPVTAEDLNRILLHSRYVIEEIGGALAARPSYCKMLPPGPPVITLFDVAVIGGVEAVVTWEVTGETDTITLNGVPVAADGVQSFPLTEDTEFTIVAENVRGEVADTRLANWIPDAPIIHSFTVDGYHLDPTHGWMATVSWEVIGVDTTVLLNDGPVPATHTTTVIVAGSPDVVLLAYNEGGTVQESRTLFVPLPAVWRATTGVTLTDGGRVAARSPHPVTRCILGNSGWSTGKRYFEIQHTTVGVRQGQMFGIVPQSRLTDSTEGVNTHHREVGHYGVGVRVDGGLHVHRDGGATKGFSTVDYLPNIVTSSANATFMVAVDLDAGKVWFGVNGTWVGDPASGTNHANAGWGLTHPDDPPIAGNNVMYPACSINSFAITARLRGSSSSFLYTPPAGFLPWGT